MNRNIFSLIEGSIKDPSRTLIAMDGEENITYGDMLKRTAQYAHALKLSGVKIGDRVAVQVDKSVECFFLYLGCMRLGAIYLPLNLGYTEKELDYFIGDASPTLFISTQEKQDILKDVAKKYGADIKTMDADGRGTLSSLADAQAQDFENAVREDDDLAAILYTSGTTGRSKGAMLTHGNLSSNAESLIECWKITSDDILLHALPIYHTHGLFVANNTVLFSGASMIFHQSFNVDNVIAALPDASMMMGVPTFYSRLLSSDAFTKELIKDMRLFVSGSAPLSAEVHKEFEARTGHAILERYGMTETNMNTSNPYDAERVPGTVGFPLPGVEVRIADPETGKILPQGDIGVIEIKGPNVFKGYWHMPEKTKSEFRDDGFFISGDLGMIDDRGYIHIVGRDKDLIITGGFNVYPAEVEAAIDAIKGVKECAVIGVPHADFGEGVTAVVVMPDHSENCDEGIRKVLSEELAKFKIPKKVYFVDELPRNNMGKIQKVVLRETYKTAYADA